MEDHPALLRLAELGIGHGLLFLEKKWTSLGGLLHQHQLVSYRAWFTLSTNFSEGTPTPGDWISQAEAARLHRVSRQAISKLIRSGRLKTLTIGGHVLVSRAEILAFQPQAAGRPASEESIKKELQRVLAVLRSCQPATRQEVLRHLREEFPIHPLEAKLGLPAETILEAISRANSLTMRGIMGVFAEATFEANVVNRLEGWKCLPVSGNPPYDFLLDDGKGPVRVQVKRQRQQAGVPKLAKKAWRRSTTELYVVETQRTRTGTDKTTNESTRPYRFGEFDILAVAMEPSTKRWDAFMYTVARWLIPSAKNPDYLQTLQPVSAVPDEDWTDDFNTCARWLRSNFRKTVGMGVSPPAPA